MARCLRCGAGNEWIEGERREMIMADETLVSVTRGKIAVHVSVGLNDARTLLEALDKSKLKDDELIVAIRKRMTALLKQKVA